MATDIGKTSPKADLSKFNYDGSLWAVMIRHKGSKADALAERLAHALPYHAAKYGPPVLVLVNEDLLADGVPALPEPWAHVEIHSTPKALPFYIWIGSIRESDAEYRARIKEISNAQV